MTGPATLGVEGRLGFVLTVPQSWFELDLQPATREESIRRLVEERVRGDETLWEQRRAMTRLLCEQAATAYDAGATYCASFSIPTEHGPVTGSVTVSLLPSLEPGDSSLLREALVPVPRSADDELAPYTEVSTVELDVRSCPRSQGIEDAMIGEGRMLRNVSMLTAVPVPELDRVFLVACSSPVLPLADDLLDLFDAVTGTFRVVRPDEPSESTAVEPTGMGDPR